MNLPGDLFGRDLQVFGAAFKEILTCLAESDPSEKNCMKSEIERSGWVFKNLLKKQSSIFRHSILRHPRNPAFILRNRLNMFHNKEFRLFATLEIRHILPATEG